ncbi:hypothetical protein L2E82_40043 [Cichorium intybus]|uniref:Uncharacterized protein n=1 Tax=Cichorium intybus TaxID=13427 RepID=A0ACB9AKV1_CICIN|nr:hypothetical protein L2E82_40043 [Cichorium intybus]
MKIENTFTVCGPRPLSATLSYLTPIYFPTFFFSTRASRKFQSPYPKGEFQSPNHKGSFEKIPRSGNWLGFR